MMKSKISTLFVAILLPVILLSQDKDQYIEYAKKVCVDEIKSIFKEADNADDVSWGRLERKTDKGKIQTTILNVRSVNQKSFEDANIKFYIRNTTGKELHSYYNKIYVTIHFRDLKFIKETESGNTFVLYTEGNSVEVKQNKYKKDKKYGDRKINSDVQYSNFFKVTIANKTNYKNVLSSFKTITRYSNLLRE